MSKSFDISNARLNAWIAEQSKGFATKRELTVGASEIGYCARKVAFKKSGAKRDEGFKDDLGYIARGNVCEDNFIAPLVTRLVTEIGGDLLWAGQENQSTIVHEKRFISATPDGLAINVHKNALKEFGVKDCGGCFLLEFKTIGERFTVSKLPKAPHTAQVNFGLGMVRWATEHKPDYGLLLYFNAGCYTIVHPFIVEFDADLFEKQKARAKRMMTTDPFNLPTEGRMLGGFECKYCEYAKLCSSRNK